MSRVYMILFSCLITLAISVVYAQHRARRLFVDLQKERDTADQLVIEWNQLQIDQGTLTSSKRIEDGAIRALQMQLPAASKTRLMVTGVTAEKEVAPVSDSAAVKNAVPSKEATR